MGNFFSELKRRKVLRVAAAYIVSSWVLLQVADLLTDILELPEWAPKLVFLILIVGFVPALILSWAFDVTPEGVRGRGRRARKGSDSPGCSCWSWRDFWPAAGGTRARTSLGQG